MITKAWPARLICLSSPMMLRRELWSGDDNEGLVGESDLPLEFLEHKFVRKRKIQLGEILAKREDNPAMPRADESVRKVEWTRFRFNLAWVHIPFANLL